MEDEVSALHCSNDRGEVEVIALDEAEARVRQRVR